MKGKGIETKQSGTGADERTSSEREDERAEPSATNGETQRERGALEESKAWEKAREPDCDLLLELNEKYQGSSSLDYGNSTYPFFSNKKRKGKGKKRKQAARGRQTR